MCGISGFISLKSFNKVEIINKMGKSLSHRGPDNFSFWSDENYGITLLHNRLSIVDLSQNSNQPKINSDGRYVLSFNGEIYNFRELVNELEFIDKNSNNKINSDTELILLAFTKFGVLRSLKKFIGMFAISVWDNKLKKLTLVRDRIGEKPLYYGYQDNNFIFSSELKAIKNFSLIDIKINPKSVNFFFSRHNVPAPYCIYENFYKLEAGNVLEIYYDDIKNNNIENTFSNLLINGKKANQTWWNIENLKNESSYKMINSFEDSKFQTKNILSNSIEMQMKADVPLGMFLSGGIDSTLITAIMQSQNKKKISTFSVGFKDTDYDESKYSTQIANYFNTNHNNIIIEPKEALDVVSLLPEIYDEPFADSSCVPTFLLSKKVSSHVKVALSGDGGDELFGGYNRYIYLNKILNKLKLIPFSLRKFFFKKLILLPTEKLIKIYLYFDKFLLTSNAKDFEKKFNKVIFSLSMSDNDFESYLNILSNPGYTNDIHDYNYLNSLLALKKLNIDDKILQNQMMYSDLITYLPDDILVKVDRASMANSLEVRTPFLDYRLIELSFRVPLQHKIKKNKGKILLREILNEYIPNKFIERPKQGFAIPISNWLRNDLKDWALDLLSPKKINENQFLDIKKVSKLWNDHISNNKDNSSILWSILMFQIWFIHNKL